MVHVSSSHQAAATVPRFNGVERAIHWTHAALFLLLLGTGLALFHPQWRNWDLAGVKLVKETHLTLALLYVLLPLTAAAWDGWRSLRHDLRHLVAWTGHDWRWLGLLLARAAGRRRDFPPQGRFNTGQKLNSFYITLVAAGLVTTGGLMWPDRLLGPDLRALVYSLHDLFMLLSLPAVALHLLLAVALPPTRPALHGMLTGRVSAAWLARHHPLDPGPPAGEG
jgi:formate dehydrogenase subunit gamma